MSDFEVTVAQEKHLQFAEAIAAEMAESAKARGTGIAKRSPEYLKNKINEGKAVIAIHKKTGNVAGFCYVESWGHNDYVANSGLIVFPEYRKFGLATLIKERAFKLSRKLFPKAKLFGLTTSLAVMKINSDLGYHPVTFSELTDDDAFWKGCQSCVNYEILQSKDRKNCLCTGMLYDAEEKKKKKWNYKAAEAILKRLKRIKENTFILTFSRLLKLNYGK